MPELIDGEVVEIPNPPVLHVGPPRLRRDFRRDLAADQVRGPVDNVDHRGLEQRPAHAARRAALAGASFDDPGRWLLARVPGATSLPRSIALAGRIGGRRQDLQCLGEQGRGSVLLRLQLRRRSGAQGDRAGQQGHADQRDHAAGRLVRPECVSPSSAHSVQRVTPESVTQEGFQFVEERPIQTSMRSIGGKGRLAGDERPAAWRRFTIRSDRAYYASPHAVSASQPAPTRTVPATALRVIALVGVGARP